MSRLRAIIFDAETGAEGRYEFDGSGLLISASAMRTAKAFFESETAQKRILPHFPDYEINTAFKHEDRWVVTLTGSLIAKTGEKVPFMAMISMIEGTDPDA